MAPLSALRNSADWAARTVLDEVRADDLAAFECVIALHEALPAIGQLLGQAPELVRLASAGPAVGDRLAAASAELARQQNALAAERADLAATRETLDRLAEVEAERGRLRAEIERAERGVVIERELPALRAKLAELTAGGVLSQRAEGENEAGEVVDGLIAAVTRLLKLTEEQRAILDAGSGRLAASLAAATETAMRALARRDELAAELATRDREAAELAAESDKTLSALRARRQADAELTTALLAVSPWPGEAPPRALERVRTEFSALEERIEDAERQLKPLIRQHQQAYSEASGIRA